ncbi:MAG: hypothetical protein ACUVXJ_19155 [Phycisphaerae bacterium]
MLGGIAMAQTQWSEIDYTIEIGGINHADDVHSGDYVAFVPGSTSPAPQTGIVTWDVVAAAAGLDQTETYMIGGIANMVFDIQLFKQDGANWVPAAPAKFFSTMNDGSELPPPLSGQNPFERAAFCLGWNVDPEYDGYFTVQYGPPNGPGRLYDVPADGGAFMDRVQFPSTKYHGGGRMKAPAYFPDCNGNLINDDTEENGTTDANSNGILDICENLGVNLSGAETLDPSKLSGMGIGYSAFSLANNSAGVGLAKQSPQNPGYMVIWNPNAYVGLGALPVAEGQIDMSNLENGIYKLVLTAPANSNNVIPADYLLTAGGFAEAVINPIAPAEVVFEWQGYVPPFQPATPVAWKSVRTHGAAGELPIALNPTDGMASVEPRNQGIKKIVITFDKAPVLAEPAVNISVSPPMTVTSQTVNGNDLIITLTGNVDKTCYTFNLTGVLSNLAAGADPTCSVLALSGDANQNKSNTTTDIAVVKSKVDQSVAANPRCDLNCDGSISTTDVALAKAKIIGADPYTCP